MIEPRTPSAIIRCATACAAKKQPRVFSPMTASKSSGVTWSNRAGRLVPALLTKAW